MDSELLDTEEVFSGRDLRRNRNGVGCYMHVRDRSYKSRRVTYCPCPTWPGLRRR
jgi:hypothetical protein